MPHKVVRPLGASRSRSLGWLALWWVETFVVHGPGAVQGEPIRHGDEYSQFVVDCYSLDTDGRRLVDSSFFSRPKGCNKSGLAAELVLFEALGPCRFDGWAKGGETFEFLGQTYTYATGEPMGRPVRSPFVRIMATEEGQTGNVYDQVHLNLKEGPLSELQAYGLDVGLTRVLLPYGGEITPSTAGSASKDGGKETFAVMDEALALDTPIPTPSGWSTMGALKVGSCIYGADGRATRVVKVTEPMDGRDCYRVTFADGTAVVASAGHLWKVRVAGSAALPKVRTTEEMVADGRRFMVPAHGPQERAEADLPLHPYLLGYWLGDGDSRNATLTIGDEDLQETTDRIISLGYTVKACQARTANRVYVSLPGAHRNRFSPVQGVKQRLEEWGLLGAKHIPAEALNGSIDQRIELVRGLMDSDGHAAPNGHCSFATNNRTRAEQMLELLRSLGEVPGLTTQKDPRSRTGECLRVIWTPRRFIPFHLQRKAERCDVTPSRRGEWLRIKSIEQVPSVPVKCVAVDNEEHLFLAGPGSHVTHNTHLYNTPGLRSMHTTVTRNLVKRKRVDETWYIETTTMYAPGEESVAEQTYKYAQAVEESLTALAEGRAPKIRGRLRMLYDHRWSDLQNLSDLEALEDAIEEAYGEALDWNSKQGLIDEIFDPRSTPEASRRYFLNALTEQHNAWITPAQVAGVTSGMPGRGEDEVAPGEQIALGFDGAQTDDATALIGCRISDGYLFEIGIWECPDGPEAADWRVDEVAVDAAVANAHARYDVVAFFADPPHWIDQVERWEREYGDGYRAKASGNSAVKWWTKLDTKMALALERLHDAIAKEQVAISANPVLVRHLINARRWPRRGGIVIGKEARGSVKKIDAAVASALAYEARAQVLNEPEKPAPEMFVPFKVGGSRRR